MCKTIDEASEKIRKIEAELELLKRELRFLKTAQCGGCRARMEALQGTYGDLLRTGD